MLQFKRLSQCNYSYCYCFGILETGEMARHLCEGIKNITNRSATKRCSTFRNFVVTIRTRTMCCSHLLVSVVCDVWESPLRHYAQKNCMLLSLLCN
jgi:hypothetical protein